MVMNFTKSLKLEAYVYVNRMLINGLAEEDRVRPIVGMVCWERGYVYDKEKKCLSNCHLKLIHGVAILLNLYLSSAQSNRVKP